MKKQILSGNINEKALLTAKEACAYTGRGYNSMKKWAYEIGAVRKYGRRVLFVKSIMDEAIMNAADQPESVKS